jgi:diguanylate cyclase (GGDEF)-like protein
MDDFRYIYVNKAFCIFLGKSREELEGHTFYECFKREGERKWLDAFANAALHKKHTYINDVSVVINKVLYSEMFHIDPDICGCLIHDFKSVSDDITNENEMLRKRANYDYLTGFYNRYYLRELRDELTNKENIGITFIDINNLKIVNDNQGHAEGDKLIKRVSDMIRRLYGDSMTFRIGGDEFVIITTGLEEEEFIELAGSNKKEFEKDHLAAVGYEFYKRMVDLDESIDHCDALMYEAKSKDKEEMSKENQ